MFRFLCSLSQDPKGGAVEAQHVGRSTYVHGNFWQHLAQKAHFSPHKRHIEEH